MLKISLFSLEQEEKNHRKHGTQQEDRVLLAVDVKGLVRLWDHGKAVKDGKSKGLGCPLAIWSCFNRTNLSAELHSIAHLLTRLGVDQP